MERLTIDTFYKSLGYAFLYKGLGETVNAVPEGELTVSIFRHGKPRELFRVLLESGRGITNPYPGVYHVFGYGIPVQIVVTRETAREEESVLRLLTHGADEEGTRQFLRGLEKLTNPGDRENARATLAVISEANLELLRRLRREAQMEQVLRIVFGEEYDIAMDHAWRDGMEKGRKEFEGVLAEKDRDLAEKSRDLAEKDRDLAKKDRELEAMARELRELKLRYGLA